MQQIAIACCIDERSEGPGDARAPLAVPASEEALLVSVNSTRFLHDEEEGQPPKHDEPDQWSSHHIIVTGRATAGSSRKHACYVVLLDCTLPGRRNEAELGRI